MEYVCTVCKTHKNEEPHEMVEGKPVCSEDCRLYLKENSGRLTEDGSGDMIEQTQLIL